MKSLIEQIKEATKMHEMAKMKWTNGRKITEKEYRTDVEILAQCVREDQDIEPAQSELILRHYSEIKRYENLEKSLKNGQFETALKSYKKIFEGFEELYKKRELEKKYVEKLMRDASYINY